jgi:hypothetical protein
MAKKKIKPAPQPGVSVPPTCSCLLLCDDVIISHAHDKHVLQGVIGMLAVPKLPAVLGGFVVYIRLSNVHAKQTVKVKFHHGDSNEVLWELVAEVINQLDPLQVHTLITRVPPFEVKESGRYIVTADHDGIPLASIPIIVHNLDVNRESSP